MLECALVGGYRGPPTRPTLTSPLIRLFRVQHLLITCVLCLHNPASSACHVPWSALHQALMQEYRVSSARRLARVRPSVGPGQVSGDNLRTRQEDLGQGLAMCTGSAESGGLGWSELGGEWVLKSVTVR